MACDAGWSVENDFWDSGTCNVHVQARAIVFWAAAGGHGLALLFDALFLAPRLLQVNQEALRKLAGLVGLLLAPQNNVVGLRLNAR